MKFVILAATIILTSHFAFGKSSKICGKNLTAEISSDQMQPQNVGSINSDTPVLFMANAIGHWEIISVGDKKDASDSCIIMTGTNWDTWADVISQGSSSSNASPQGEPTPNTQIGGEPGSVVQE